MSEKHARLPLLVLVVCLVAVTNTAIGDGADTCDEPPPLITSLPFVDSGDTTGFTNTVESYTGTCTNPFSYDGEDQIYELNLGEGNNVEFTLDLTGSSGDLNLFLITPCGDGTGCVANALDFIGPGVGPEVIPSDSYTPGTYYVYVDSYYGAGTPGSAGTFTLTVEGEIGEFEGDCCVPIPIDCCEPHDDPGCDEPAIEACVCDVDPFCCTSAWDVLCVEQAVLFGCTDCVPNDFTCQMLTESQCTAADGEFGAEGGLCEPGTCDPPPPGGTCCEGDPASCSITTELECSGSWTEGGECLANTCAGPTIPTLGEWGMIIMTLLLLTAGGILFNRESTEKG